MLHIRVQRFRPHRGGPVATGKLEGSTLTCPWHGYQYNLQDGVLLNDPRVHLDTYPVEVREGMLYLHVPLLIRDPLEGLNFFRGEEGTLANVSLQPSVPAAKLAENEFHLADLPPGQARRVHFQGEAVAVYNVGGRLYATQDACTHADGPLSEGALEGSQIICPWHGSCFDVSSGAVLCGPATDPVKTFTVLVDNGIGMVRTLHHDRHP